MSKTNTTGVQTPKPRASVVGAGKFGLAIAEILCQSNIQTELITRSDERTDIIRQSLTQTSPLLSVNKFGDATLGNYVFLAIPSSDLPDMVSSLATDDQAHSSFFILLSKGLTPPDAETPYELVARSFGTEQSVVLSGPSIADELLQFGCNLVVASDNHKLAENVASMISSDKVHCQLSDDPKGVEWSGIAKNIATLGFHASAVATNSYNIAGTYAARLYEEVWRYAVHHGAQPTSFIGISGVGDLLTTSHAPSSRNVRGGQLIGQGLSVNEAEAQIKQVVEAFRAIPLLERRINDDNSITPTTPAMTSLSQLITGEVSHGKWLESITSQL